MENEDLENNNEKTAMVRKKSEEVVVASSNGRLEMLRNLMTNLQVVFLGTKLVVLFPAVPLAVVASFYGFGRVSGAL